MRESPENWNPIPELTEIKIQGDSATASDAQDDPPRSEFSFYVRTADYQDSPDSTYIEVAAVELALALAAAVGGIWALRER